MRAAKQYSGIGMDEMTAKPPRGATGVYLPHFCSLIVLAVVLLVMTWLICRGTLRTTPVDNFGVPMVWTQSFSPNNNVIGFGRGWPATYLSTDVGAVFTPNLWIDAAIAAVLALVCATICETWLRRRPHVAAAIRKKFRIRLMTLVITMIAIGAMLWINMRPKISSETQTFLAAPGWPIPFLRVDFSGENATELRKGRAFQKSSFS